jgi:hypothetical protein
MKRCPQCYQLYPDAENFCELDGRHLLIDVAVLSPIGKVVDTAVPVPDPSAQKREARMMVVVGVMVGMLVTSIGYAGYAFFRAEATPEESSVPVSRAETIDNRQPTRPTRTAVIEPSPAPEEESSPSPEAEAEAEEVPAAKTDAIAARLNQGPVSTGDREQKLADRSDKTIIEMNDGTRVEVDAAWQDNQGVWYRRGGLVSFVESKRIKAIQARQESKPDPVSSPTP